MEELVLFRWRTDFLTSCSVMCPIPTCWWRILVSLSVSKDKWKGFVIQARGYFFTEWTSECSGAWAPVLGPRWWLRKHTLIHIEMLYKCISSSQNMNSVFVCSYTVRFCVTDQELVRVNVIWCLEPTDHSLQLLYLIKKACCDLSTLGGTPPPSCV